MLVVLENILILIFKIRPWTAYAAWFDYKRRTDPEFRRQLKRDIRRHVRAEKEEEEAEKTQRKDDIQRALETAKKDGFPTDVEEKEAYFLTSISQGEAFVGQGTQSSFLTLPLPCTIDFLSA